MPGPLVSISYSDNAVASVSAAIGLGSESTERREKLRAALETASLWFALSQDPSGLVPTAGLIKALKRLGKTADRVQRHAEAMTVGSTGRDDVTESNRNCAMPRRSPDRYRDRLAALNALIVVSDPDQRTFMESSLAEALCLSEHTGKARLEAAMAVINDADSGPGAVADAARDLALRAHDAAARLTWMRSNMIRPGHSGDVAMNGWIDHMLNLFVEVTGRPVALSTGAPGQPNEGIASGPLVRFLEAAFKPVAEELAAAGRDVPDLHEDAWASRVGTARKAKDGTKA